MRRRKRTNHGIMEVGGGGREGGTYNEGDERRRKEGREGIRY